MYPDYIVFSVLQWARIISDYELLDTDDPLWHWRERILNLFDGLARGV
jgi:glutathione S-transferase